MRFFRCSLFLGVLLSPVAALLTGCGAGAPALPGDVPSDAIGGVVHGGQNPISGASIYVVYYGYTGYGTAVLATPVPVTTDASGTFNFPHGYYTCTPSTAQIYLLSVGGDTGSGANPNAVLAAPIGTCGNVSSVKVVMDEVSTISVAYALSHYFPTVLGGSTPQATDFFGGPAAASSSAQFFPDANGIGLGNSYTTSLIYNSGDGEPTQSSGIVTTEASKVATLANILGACINSGGGSAGDGSDCGNLFTATTTPGGQVPTDTLQAAVQMALYPTQNVSALYMLGSERNTAFSGGLDTTPADLSLAVSYTSSTLGMGVDTGTLATIDIDSTNKVWFTSSATNYVGVAYFDPTQTAFFGPYNDPGLIQPEQIAIDKNSNVWATDTQGSVIAGFYSANPASYTVKSLANSNSYGLTIGSDDAIETGVLVGTTYSLARVDPSSNVYATTKPVTAGFTPYSLAADESGDYGLDLFLATTPSTDIATARANSFTKVGGPESEIAGQTVWNGTNFISIIANGNSAGNDADALCLDTGSCYSFNNGTPSVDTPQGAAVDGSGTLWLADQGNATVQYVPFTSGSYVGGLGSVTPAVLTHNSSNGGTLTTPEGIAVDNEGNVWVANAGCTGVGCIQDPLY